MQRLRYDLKLLFVAMSNICVLVWALAHASMVAFPLVAVTASISSAWCVAKGRQPIVLGALGGFAGVTILTACVFVSHGIGYFFYTGTTEYFEDGAFAELVIFPIIFVLVWGSIGLLIGTICGVVVLVLQKSLTSINR